MKTCFSFVLVAALVGCGSSEATTSGESTTETFVQEEQELKISFAIETAANSMILGSSKDGRYVVYGTGCDGSGPSQIRLFDDRTFRKWTLASGVPCMPGSYFFSPDGNLLTFGDGAGNITAFNVSTGTRKLVGVSGIGVSYSPDSSWFVVARAEAAPMSAALDAWPADLSAKVEVATGAFFSPFFAPPGSGGFEALRFSADGAQLLFVGQITTVDGFASGSLTLWNRASRTSTVVATQVQPFGYLATADLGSVAYLRDAARTQTSPRPVGKLVLHRLPAGPIETLEDAVVAQPLAFLSGGALLYQVATTAPASELRLRRAGPLPTTSVIDTNVLMHPSFSSVALTPAGDAVAYFTGFNQEQFTGELRLTSLAAGSSPRVLATDAVPMTASWASAGRTLVYLQHPSSAGFGSAMGTLSAYEVSTGRTREVGTNVTQLGLRVVPGSDEVLFVSSYDQNRATGNYRSWNATTFARKLFSQAVAVMSIRLSPDGKQTAYLTQAAGSATARLRFAQVGDNSASQLVASDVTTLSLGVGGRLAYTGPSGLFGAWVF